MSNRPEIFQTIFRNPATEIMCLKRTEGDLSDHFIASAVSCLILHCTVAAPWDRAADTIKSTSCVLGGLFDKIWLGKICCRSKKKKKCSRDFWFTSVKCRFFSQKCLSYNGFTMQWNLGMRFCFKKVIQMSTKVSTLFMLCALWACLVWSSGKMQQFGWS